MFLLELKLCIRNRSHKQYSPLDIIFNYICWDLQATIYKQVEETDYPSAGFAWRSNTNDHEYTYLLYLIDYVVYLFNETI